MNIIVLVFQMWKLRQRHIHIRKVIKDKVGNRIRKRTQLS